jgi:type IV pilus assembly protein PilA
MNRSSRGFTLIEVTTVVLVIALLSSVSLPAYESYSARGKISEVMLALSGCRTNIAEMTQSASALPFGGEWACETEAGQSASRYVESIETSDEGAVRARIRNVNAKVDGQYIMLRPWANLARSLPIQAGDFIARWDCGPAPNNVSDIREILPASCRAAATDLGATSGWSSAT